MGFVDAFQGIVRHPYLGAKQEGFGGFGKGIGRACGGFWFHSMAGVCSLFSMLWNCTDTVSDLCATWIFPKGHRKRPPAETSHYSSGRNCPDSIAAVLSRVLASNRS